MCLQLSRSAIAVDDEDIMACNLIFKIMDGSCAAQRYRPYVESSTVCSRFNSSDANSDHERSATLEWFQTAVKPSAPTSPSDGRCCRTLSSEDSHCESMRLDGRHEQADARPLPHDELVQLHCFTSHTLVAVDLAGQGDDLARSA